MAAKTLNQTTATLLRRLRHPLAVVIGGYLILAACMNLAPPDARRHGWWKGLGPVMPHDTFPADCSLCHVGSDWQTLREDFVFDHEAETGYALDGAHGAAQCLLCHNDRGPVETFAARSCAGCHEDVHQGFLGPNCVECHTEVSWRPFGQVERHFATRFPLIGAHAMASCRSCHLGAEAGRFQPVDTACVSCHQGELARTANPPHLGLGWVDRCDRCHVQTNWNQARVVPE